MYGALLGDMIGAPYEFDRGNKTKEFPLFCKYSHFTDDSVMTIAVAEALLDFRFREDEDIKAGLVESMRKWGKKYPNAGYGRKFYRWLHAKHPEPYGSYGNGSAMRVSSAGWLFDTLADTRHMARLTAEVTHNVLIEDAIARYYEASTQQNLIGVLDAILQRSRAGGHFLIPVIPPQAMIWTLSRTISASLIPSRLCGKSHKEAYPPAGGVLKLPAGDISYNLPTTSKNQLDF